MISQDLTPVFSAFGFFLLFLYPIARVVCDMPELGLQDSDVRYRSGREPGCHCTSMS